MIELQSDNLAQVLKDNDKVLVQFGATWCGNCRMLKPKLKRLADEMTDIAVIYVDAEKFPESRALAEVSNLPTFAIYKGAELVKQAQGNKFDKVKELADEIASH